MTPSAPIAGDPDRRLLDLLPRVLDAALDRRRMELERLAPESAELPRILAAYLEGGKLLRPRFVLWAAECARSVDEALLTSVATAGAAVELVQAAALLHDDVIDNSPMRRGRPAVHVAAAQQHRRAGLSGDPVRFGEAVAIILGDLALSWAEQLAAPVLAEHPAARPEFDALRTEVMAGQHLDMLHQAGGFLSPADPVDAARTVIRWKTVSYTVHRPLRIGARLAGADDELLQLLDEVAVPVGTAFQLRDDLLSVVGDPADTGKPVGGDVTEGKRTVVLELARTRADERQRTALEAAVGRQDATPGQVQDALAVLRATGAVAEVVAEVESHAQRARDRLYASDAVRAEGREGLLALIDRATDVGFARAR
ncbi:polyprenyl synthetase family protein [Brachybacterium sp. EF45031]|uniref:polyprenyl synthetase family protein n=1 Tax=Brachybacterium sillae TaxID=2810536 RepID=UPI00217E3917|nr:polyprenyl synthetase family protein [Brachybacterium sillae]MCS6710496.1 polyprenyl synthetase family protein [Brachybacterium sillae]